MMAISLMTNLHSGYVFIKNVTIKSPGKWWNVILCHTRCANIRPYKRWVRAPLLLISKPYYGLKGTVDSFNLKPLTSTWRKLSNYGNFGGLVDANVEGRAFQKISLHWKHAGWLPLEFSIWPIHAWRLWLLSKVGIGYKEATGRKKIPDWFGYAWPPVFSLWGYDSLDNLTAVWQGRYKTGIHSQEGQYNLILKIAEYLNELVRNFAQSYYK